MNSIRETSPEESEGLDSDDSDLIIIKTSNMSKSRSKHSTTDTFPNPFSSSSSSSINNSDTDDNNDNTDTDTNSYDDDDDDDDYDDSGSGSDSSGDGSGSRNPTGSSVEENTLIRIKDRATECKEGRTVKKSYMWRVVPEALVAEREGEALEVETPHQFSITVESILPVMTFKVALPKPTEEITFEQQGPSTIILRNGSKGSSGSFVFNVTMHYLTRVETYIAITSYCKIIIHIFFECYSHFDNNYR